MNIDLDKNDLINLVRGQPPYYPIFDNVLIKSSGYYNDNKGWVWYKYELDKLTEQELFDLYQLCKDSWK